MGKTMCAASGAGNGAGYNNELTKIKVPVSYQRSYIRETTHSALNL